MIQKKISVIIATKNGGRFLARSIASIEMQTEKDVEVIIVSDGSTDNTVSIARELTNIRPFITVIELEKNVGPGLARNAGIQAAHGDYIALLDDDDEWLDADKLAVQKNFLNSHPEHVLVGASETEFVNENGKMFFVYKPKTDHADICNKILISNQFITSSVMFKKSAFERAGGFAPMYLAEDYDLWLRIAQIGSVANLADCKTRYYSRSAGAQQSNKNKINAAVLNIVKKYRNKFPHGWLALIAAYLRKLLR